MAFKPTNLIPFCVALATLGASVFVHFVHLDIQQDRMHAGTQEVTANFATRLETHLASRLSAALLLRSHFHDQTPLDTEEFRSEMELFHELIGGLQALNWVDATGVIRLVTPLEGNAAALGLNLNTLPVPAKTLALADASGELTVTTPIELAQGGKGFVAYLPLSSDGQKSGYLNIVFRAAPLMRQALNENSLESFNIRVEDDGLELFSAGATPSPIGLVDSQQITVGGRVWDVFVAPLPNHVRQFDTIVDELILILGALISVLVGGLVHLTMKRQESLRHSQTRFQDFASASTDWFWELDQNNRVSWCSDGIEDFFGVSKSEFIGRRRGDFRKLASDEQNWKNHFADLEAHRPFKDFEYEIDVNGTQKWARASGVPIFDEDGEFQGYRGVATDITETIRARRQVEQSNQFLANAVEGLSELFTLWDADDRMVLCNRVFRDVNSNVAEYTVPGTSFHSFISASIATGIVKGTKGHEEAYVQQAIERRNSYDAPSFEVERTDGTVLRLREQRLEGGGFVTIGQDVTKERKDAEALRASEERLALAVESLTIWDWNLETREFYISAGFAEALGYSDEEFEPIMQRSFVDIIHPDDAEQYLIKVADHLKDASMTFKYKYRLRTKSGIYKSFLAQGQTVANDQGRAIRTIGVLTDITTRVELEERLHQSQKMEAIGQLTGGVAHDFNNLLAVILGNAELLEDISDNDELSPLISSIIRASERGAELTQRLLAFSRRQPLMPIELDLSSLMSNLPALLKPVLGETVALDLTVEDAIWTALADPSQVENALLNLALNSRDAMPQGGHLSIDCFNTTFEQDHSEKSLEIEAGEYVVLSVTDTGVGMSEQTIEHACEPFFTTKEVGKGSGLGLSMVLGFAQQSGGQVSVISEEGRGTTVKLFLPRAQPSGDASGEEAPLASPRGQGETVLLIEDDPALRVIAEQMLRKNGYKTVTSADAIEAGQALDAHPEIALILSDVVLPGRVNGPTFVQEALKTRPDLKVIFMSGHPADALDDGGAIFSGHTLLNKPFKSKELAKAIQSVFGG